MHILLEATRVVDVNTHKIKDVNVTASFYSSLPQCNKKLVEISNIPNDIEKDDVIFLIENRTSANSVKNFGIINDGKTIIEMETAEGTSFFTVNVFKIVCIYTCILKHY